MGEKLGLEMGEGGVSRSLFSLGKIAKDVGHFPLTKCLCPQYVSIVPGMSPGPHFRPNESYFTTPQNLKGEHSFVGAPAPL